ncbi:MAG: hypothetical protein ACOX3T_05380 [Bdellovibrionota bacterium]
MSLVARNGKRVGKEYKESRKTKTVVHFTCLSGLEKNYSYT